MANLERDFARCLDGICYGCGNVFVFDDVKGVTITSASSHVKDSAQKVNKTDQAKLIGKEIAENASKAGIKEVVFDRNGYLYHGRVKALAESARENGLKF